jgi:hypothetical protein
MTGIYRIALLPGADERAFVKHMRDVVFKNPNALQLTRITRGFEHRLLKMHGDLRLYAWQATVDLQTDSGYDFAQNAHVQKSIQEFGVLIGVEAYTNMEGTERGSTNT